MFWWYYQIYCLAPAVDHKGGGNGPLASGIKQSVTCPCWGSWFLPWVSSFPLSTPWREQGVAVLHYEILNTSLERPILPPEGCPSVWSTSVATVNVVLPLLSPCRLSLKYSWCWSPSVWSFSCKIYFWFTCGFCSVWMTVYEHIQLFIMLLKWMYNEIVFNETEICGYVFQMLPKWMYNEIAFNETEGYVVLWCGQHMIWELIATDFCFKEGKGCEDWQESSQL